MEKTNKSRSIVHGKDNREIIAIQTCLDNILPNIDKLILLSTTEAEKEAAKTLHQSALNYQRQLPMLYKYKSPMRSLYR
jgi:hypothetical protein